MGKVKFVIRKGRRILYEGGSWGFRILVDKLVEKLVESGLPEWKKSHE